MSLHYTIKTPVSHEIKIKRSQFICSLFPVQSIAEAKHKISEISSEHKTANHNCWSYVIGHQGEVFHASDAGEPSGTAGKPMLNSLMKHHLSNIVCVVTRYFGGVKLGIRGLIDAYGESVEQAILQADLKKLVETSSISIQTSYDFAEILKYQVEQYQAVIKNIDYLAQVCLKLQIEKENFSRLNEYLQSMQQAGKIQYKVN